MNNLAKTRTKKNSRGITFAKNKFSYLTGHAGIQSKYFQNYSSKLLKVRTYNNLKEELSFPELCEATDFLYKNLPKIHSNLIYGNPLPKNYNELGNCESFPFFRYDRERKRTELESEINWTLIGIRKFKFEINLFIAYKVLYEKALLTGNYSEAEKYLDKIENEICFSLWSLENRYLLGELSGTSVKNKEVLNIFNENNKSRRGITKILSHYLSQRAEKALSINRFSIDLNFYIDGIQGELSEIYSDYYRFKLSYLNHINFSHFDGILLLDFSHSIIDRYISLVKVFTNILTTSNNNDSPEASAIKNYVANRINYLIRKVNDPILFKLKLFSSNKIFPAFDAEESKREVEVIDKYTIGLYQEVQEELSKLLLEKPTQFDLYVLYVKSLIYQKKPLVSIGNSKSIQNIILQNIFKIVSASVSPKQLGISLLSIANNISGCELSYGIIDFVFFQTEGKKERELLSRLSYNCANPIISEIYPNDSSKLKYLDLLETKYPDSTAVQFFKNRLKSIDNFQILEEKIPEARFKTEYAKKLQKREAFYDAASVWEELIKHHFDTVPIWEIAIKNLYICYEKLELFDNCIKLYVNSFMKNNFIIEKIETESLSNSITKSAFRKVSKTIELPIFFTIIGADETITHLALELFNNKLGVLKPSNLFDRVDEFEREKMIYFFKRTCSSETLRNSPFITNSKERLEERLIISEFLREIDFDDKQFYDDEIKDIRNILIIQKGLIELDESKIYVNEQGIINNELKDYEAIFLRFQSISKIVGDSKYWMLDLKGGNINTVNYGETDKEVEYSSNPVFDIYLELFDAIKDKFLYSKFGIVTYLSTRIRHGVLIGEIRPVFEKHKLITLKEGNTSNYRKNLYWDNVYNLLPESKKLKLHNELKDFSSLIDGLIFDLIKKYLQVYNESNKEGWFNYDFNNNYLFKSSLTALDSKNFNDFSQQVIDLLWKKTDENLDLIRDRIQNDIATKVNVLFNNFEQNIVNVLGKDISGVLLKAIKDCSTETQVVIKKISSWFKRSGTVASDFELSSLIEMVIQQTDKNNRIEINKELGFNCKINGKYLRDFADLLRIFIENILKHSDKTVPKLNAKITTKKIDNLFLHISIENNITKQESVSSFENVWKENIIDLNKLHSENKSGYYKAYKILKDDLVCTKADCLRALTNSEESKFIVYMKIDLKDLLVE